MEVKPTECNYTNIKNKVFRESTFIFEFFTIVNVSVFYIKPSSKQFI